MSLSAIHQETLNKLIDYIPALRKGQFSPAEGGDIKLGDLIADALAVAASEITLADGKILIGGADGKAHEQTMSSEASISNTGAVTLANAAVIGKAITGFVSGSGALLATDTLLQAIQKLDGNVGTKLDSSAFTDAAVTGKLITGFVSGAGVVAVGDTILQAINKLDGNVAAKAAYSEPAVSLTFDHAVGATACVARLVGKTVTLEIPACAMADGLGTVLSSGAGDLGASLRPAADLTFPVLVNNNAGTMQFGLLTISAAGTVTFGIDATNAGFTNAAAAATTRVAVGYTVA